MSIEIQDFVNVTLGMASAGLGWFARELWSAVKELKKDLSALRESIAVYYVRKDDFGEFRRELMTALQRIEDKLDSKQDKKNG